MCIFWLILKHSVAPMLLKSSNGWVREQTGFSDFNGQEGYIGSQVEHHRTTSFQTQLMELLLFAKIPYDPIALD